MSHHDKPAGKKSEGWGASKIVAIVCNWCTYAGADLAGVEPGSSTPEREDHPAALHGQDQPLHRQGASGRGRRRVVLGSDPGECHYLTGNLSARRKFATLKSFLNYIGLEDGRSR